MANYVKVLVYVKAPEAEKLRENGVSDIPTWVRSLVKDSIQGIQPADSRSGT